MATPQNNQAMSMQKPREEYSPGEGDIAHTLMRMEEQWNTAFKMGDPAKVATLLSEIFVAMNSDGTYHTKAEQLSAMKGAKWETSEISNMKVTVHGGMALVTGQWHGKGTLADGKMVDRHECWLDTWLKNGKWQCVASASTAAKI
jgi:ketosteroid isomerase-like protein